MQHGAVGLERLFQRRGDDLLAPLGLEDPAFAVFRFQRHDGRDAHLGGFFQNHSKRSEFLVGATAIVSA